MDRPEDAAPAEVLRAKRLEIVDDEGKVRAALGTDEKGIASLSLFDASGRLRSSLDADELSGHSSGLALYDTDGNHRAAVGTNNDPEEKVSSLVLYDTNGKVRAGLGADEQGSDLTLFDTEGKPRAKVGLQTGGRAWVSVLAGKKSRSVKFAAMDDGDIMLELSGEGAPMVGLSLSEEQGQDAYSNLVLADKDDRAGVSISVSRSAPNVRLRDRRLKVRASLELGANGEPGLYIFDEEGAPVRGPNAFERVVAGRGPVYQAILFGALLVGGGVVGAWIATTGSAATGSLPAALVTVLVLATLVSLLVVARRRGW